MSKLCEWCGKEVESPNKKTRFCCRVCANKHMWSNDKIKKQIILSLKESSNTDIAKERLSKNSKEYHNRPDVKIKQSIEKKAWHEVPENKTKLKEILNRDYAITANSKRAKEYQNRPDIKEKQSNFQKEYQNRQDVKEANRQRSINMWKDLERSDRHMKSCYKYKDYVLPSGKIVKIQGYEPQILDELLIHYTENDIVIGIKEINYEIGQIDYLYKNNIHRYYPDFYIKSTNTIIEVKSKWTFNLHKERNKAKENACIEQGFNFEFKII